MDIEKISKLDSVSQIFLIGGGYSISPHLKELQTKLKNKFVISLNYAYRDFPNATIQCFTDVAYWNEQRIHQDLLNLPLIIARNQGVKYSPNVISLKPNTKIWTKDLKEGIYSPNLTGTFAIALALYLIEGTLFLFGFDFGNLDGKKTKNGVLYSHYNQDTFVHRGTGQFSYYNIKTTMDTSFKVFKNENILNVGLESKLPFFKKISYNQFYSKVNSEKVNNEELRKEIKEKLETLKK